MQGPRPTRAGAGAWLWGEQRLLGDECGATVGALRGEAAAAGGEEEEEQKQKQKQEEKEQQEGEEQEGGCLM